jgi:hypothetical protein
LRIRKFAEDIRAAVALVTDAIEVIRGGDVIFCLGFNIALRPASAMLR